MEINIPRKGNGLKVSEGEDKWTNTSELNNHLKGNNKNGVRPSGLVTLFIIFEKS